MKPYLDSLERFAVAGGVITLLILLGVFILFAMAYVALNGAPL